MMQLSSTQNPEQLEVAQLLERRATIQEWLVRLDAQRGAVSPRVLEKVQQDYEERLRSTLASLATHRRTLQDELQTAGDRLVAAEEAHRTAVDELEETRLRNLIGEVNDDAWSERRDELSAAVDSANAEQSRLESEVARLRELLDQLEDRHDEEEPVVTFSLGEIGDEPIGEPIYDEITLEDQVLPVQVPREPMLAVEAESRPFLDEIDLALADGHDDDALPNAIELEVNSEDTAPKPGLKCSECGYTNDLSAWFCGVCGADVG